MPWWGNFTAKPGATPHPNAPEPTPRGRGLTVAVEAAKWPSPKAPNDRTYLGQGRARSIDGNKQRTRVLMATSAVVVTCHPTWVNDRDGVGPMTRSALLRRTSEG
jgi:hypothetical protein